MYIRCSVLNRIPVHSVTSLLTIYICKFKLCVSTVAIFLLNTDYTVAPSINANNVMEMHTCTSTFILHTYMQYTHVYNPTAIMFTVTQAE